MNLGILLWNTCNAMCDHCAVSSSPFENGYMTDEQIFPIIDSAFYDCKKPKIGLSGGEAFLYFERLCNIVDYAINKGAEISINTNGFWGVSLTKAKEKVKKLKEMGVRALIVSIDDFHQEFIHRDRVINVIRACKEIHLEVKLQFVATKSSGRLADFLHEHGDDLLNIECREIPCHPVGRASFKIKDESLFTTKGVPQGLCPSSVMSISAYGKVIPCCNTAGHLPSLEVGDISQSIIPLHKKFLKDPIFNLLRLKGPKAFYESAINMGYNPREDGYIDQCHLCYDLFKNNQLAEELKDFAAENFEHELYETYLEEYTNNYSQILNMNNKESNTSNHSL